MARESGGAPAARESGRAGDGGSRGATAAGTAGACRRRGNQGRVGGGGSRGEQGAYRRRENQGRIGGGGSRGEQGRAGGVDSRGAPAAWTAGAHRRRGKQGHASVHSLHAGSRPRDLPASGRWRLERDLAGEDLVGMQRRSAEAEEDGRDLGDFFHLFIFLIRGPLCGSKIIFWVFLQNDE
jgi:hypothetical protein